MKKLAVPIGPENFKELEQCWTAFMQFSRPRADQWLSALAVEDVLRSVTEPAGSTAAVRCRACGAEFTLAETFEHVPDLVQHFSDRVARVPATLKFTDDGLEYLKSVIRTVRPPQSAVKHYVRLMNMLEMAKPVEE